MRPMVGQGQCVPKIVPRLVNPHSETAVRILHGVLERAASAPV